MANRILRRNPIIAAVVNNLNVTLFDVDAVQRRLDFVRAQIAENSAIYADAAPQLAQGSRRLAEAMFGHLAAASSRHAPPESESEEEQKKTQPQPALLAAAEEPDEEEEIEELAAALAAEFAQVAAGIVRDVQEQREAVVWFEVEDLEVAAIADEYLGIAIRVERCRRKDRILVQARAFLLLVRAAAIAITRAHLLPGVLVTVAAAYALAYAASGGAVVPGSASLLRISALVLCFLFRVPVLGNLA